MTTDPEADAPDLEQELREGAVQRVAAGFESQDEIVEGLVETFGDEADPDEIRPIARRVTAEALAAHLVAQQTWPVPTDNDRLDRAFAALEAGGIVARQNFTCCQSCGHGEIGDEIGDRPARGYTFFHMQDTEAAVDGHGIFLAYGAASPDGDAVAIGRAIVAALEREGLKPDWDGSLERRIYVRMDWKKRRSVAGGRSL